ncbi:MAG: hypothetical protein JWR22_2615, partial [Herminiimonas sp.]|nr:hypothetical protein [Herminiimonas sp.]
MEHDDIDDAEEELLFKAAVEALDNIKKRCDACKMVYEDLSQFADSDFYLEIRFPCGPETRFMPLVDGNDLIKFNAIPFEKYVCLSNYAAIASYEDGTIEAVISAPMTPPGPLSR